MQGGMALAAPLWMMPTGGTRTAQPPR